MSALDTQEGQVKVTHRRLDRSVYEDFLYREAGLLDEWRLDEWLALFTADATYEVPTNGADLDIQSNAALFYIADDRRRLQHRVQRLKSPEAHAEWPRSIGVRLVGNLRVLGADETGVQIVCSFVTYRSKNHVTDTYIGHSYYTIVEVDGDLRIRSKRVMLGMNSLRPHGKVSIIL